MRQISTVSVLALVIGSGIVTKGQESGSYDGSGDGGSKRDYEYGPCAVSTPAECFEIEASRTDDTDRATECAWVVPRNEGEYCWYGSDDGDDDAEYLQCRELSSDSSPGCGFCFNIYSNGYEYATYTCAEIVEQYDINGVGDDYDVYCKDEYSADDVPESVSYYCADLGVDPDERVDCIDDLCGEQRDTCENDDGQYGCLDLLDNLQREVIQWDYCTTDRWVNESDENWDADRDVCSELCPGDFRQDDDYFECDNLFPFYVNNYCVSNATRVARYGGDDGACSKLEEYGKCNAEYCDSNSCERQCPNEFISCWFTDGCYNEYRDFEAKLDEEEENIGEDIFAKYYLENIYEEFCEERDGGCSDEMDAIYNCAKDACLRGNCLTGGSCDDAWETCLDDEACVDSFQNTFCAVLECGDDDDMEESTTAEPQTRRRLLETDYSCCDCCQEDGSIDDECEGDCDSFECENCEYYCCDCCEDDGSIKDDCEGDCDSFEGQCDSCGNGDGGYSEDEISECCQCCSEDGFRDDCTSTTQCQYDDFDCGACDSQNDEERRDDDDDDGGSEMIYLYTNYMKWWYNYRCNENSENAADCDNDEFEAVLTCINDEDSDCAEVFEKSNSCIGGCREKVFDCFASEECGGEFDDFWTYQDECDSSSSGESGSSESDCDSWRYDGEGNQIYDDVSYQQYQCFKEGGCSTEYYELWTCIWPCMILQSADEERYECMYYEDSDSDEDSGSSSNEDDDEDDCEDDCIIDCVDELVACFFDEDCYNDATYFFDDFMDGDVFGDWIESELEAGNTLDDESFWSFLEEEFCSMEGRSCDENFNALASCLWDNCFYPMFPCYITGCYQYIYNCMTDEDCCVEGCTYFSEGDSDSCAEECPIDFESESRRRRLQDDSADEAQSESGDGGGLFDLNVPDYGDSGTQEDRDAWTSEVYDASCDGDSSSCTEMWVQTVECFADACIYDADADGDDADGVGGADSSAFALSTLLSMIAAIFSAAFILG